MVPQDALWKMVLSELLQSCFNLLFADFADCIDWSQPPVFLDHEFQALGLEHEIGNREADMLIKVVTLEGQEQWLLIHIEIQNQRDNDFARRVYIYNYRIYDKYKLPVYSFAILGDSAPNWKPDHFGYHLKRYGTRLDFGVAKILDYRTRREELKNHQEPIAKAILAHLIALETKGNPQERLYAKTQLTRDLYECGFKKEIILILYRFIDVRIDLPAPLEQQYKQEVKRFEEEKAMFIVTPIEELALAEGIEKGYEKGIEQGIEQGESIGMRKEKIKSLRKLLFLRFGDLTLDTDTHLLNAENDTLDTWFERALKANSLQEIWS